MPFGAPNSYRNAPAVFRNATIGSRVSRAATGSGECVSVRAGVVQGVVIAQAGLHEEPLFLKIIDPAIDIFSLSAFRQAIPGQVLDQPEIAFIVEAEK